MVRNKEGKTREVLLQGWAECLLVMFFWYEPWNNSPFFEIFLFDHQWSLGHEIQWAFFQTFSQSSSQQHLTFLSILSLLKPYPSGSCEIMLFWFSSHFSSSFCFVVLRHWSSWRLSSGCLYSFHSTTYQMYPSLCFRLPLTDATCHSLVSCISVNSITLLI